MNMTKTMRNWCLALVSIALLAVAGASNAAPGGRLKLFYAKLGGYVGTGTAVPVTLVLYNTSTEPATINTALVCNVPGLEFTAGSLLAGGLAGNAIDYTGGLCADGGVIITNFTGLRRNETGTFVLPATVTGSCSAPSPGDVIVSASTGNSSSSYTADFYATTTDSSGNPTSFPADPLVTTVAIPVIPGCDGTIQCGQNVPLTFTNGAQSYDPWEPGQATSLRELWNSNGAACKLVPYNFTNALLTTDNNVVLLWPQSTDQKNALFRTSVTGKPRDHDGTVPLNPDGFNFGWRLDTVTGDPIYGTALMCLDQEAPRPYATVVTEPGVALSTFQVSYTINPPPPTPPTNPVEPGTGIADPNGWKPIPGTGEFYFSLRGERIRAKFVSESTSGNVVTATLQVVGRNVAGTTQDPTATNFLLSVVMPIAPTGHPYAGEIVRMCAISTGVRMWVPRASTGTSLPQPRYFQFIEYYDGDGWGVER